MTNLRRPKLLVLVLMLILILQSCAEMKSRIEHTSEESNGASVQAVDLARKYMEASEYQNAIDVYNVEYRKHPGDQALMREYVRSIENIKLTADKGLSNEDFLSACKNYNVLLKNYPHFKGFDKNLSFNSTDLNKRFSHCKKAISKRGFQEYRKGNISGAIMLWEGLLAIAPDNTDIKEWLRTAKLQQTNLQEKE